MSNVLYYGDNLPVLRKWIDDESVDLVYLDPPFNSKKMYNQIFKESAAQTRVFKDYWEWDDAADAAYRELTGAASTAPREAIALLEALRRSLGTKDPMAYLVMMTQRLVELRRVLKPTGSLFLHCDPTASHYLKVVLDAIFGPERFRNEIIWRRTGSHKAPRSLGRLHDTILWFAKGDENYFSPQKRPYMRGHVESRYTADETGRLRFSSGGNVLTGPGIRYGESGAQWRGFDPTKKKRNWAVPGYLAEQMPDGFDKLGSIAKLDALFEAGLIEIVPGAAWPVPVKFLNDDDGEYLSDIWAYQPYTQGAVHGSKSGIDEDISWLGPTDPERVGYPTQKPIGLLERIIRVACPPNGIVLDPFCGCGTTIEAAIRLNRKWLGIDVAPQAVDIIGTRMAKIGVAELDVVGWPMDLVGARRLAADDKIGFQRWAVFMAGGRMPDGRQYKGGADGGVDGEIIFDDGGRKLRAIVSVKGGGLGANDIRVLRNVVDDSKSHMGIFISMQEPTKAMRDIARDGGHVTASDGEVLRKIQLLTAEELLAGKLPDLPGRNVTPESSRSEPRKGENLALPFGKGKTKLRGAPVKTSAPEVEKNTKKVRKSGRPER